MKRLFLLTILLVAFSIPGFATTFYVATTGDDGRNCTQAQVITTPMATVAHFLATCTFTAGDTLYLRAGTYTDPGTDEAIIYVSGKNGAAWTTPVTISAYPGETVTLAPDNGGSGALSAVALINSDYVQILNFVMDCNKVGGATCVRNNDAGNSHNRFQGNEIKNTGHFYGACGSETMPDNENGIISDYPDHEYINNHIHDNGRSAYDHGFYGGGDRVLIQGNEIDTNCGNGYQGGGVDQVIKYNKAHGNGASGVGGSGLGVFYDSGTAHVWGNLSYGNYGAGIRFQYGGGLLEAINNTTYNNGTDGGGLSARGIDNEDGTASCINNISVESSAPTYQCTTSTTNTALATLASGDSYFVARGSNDFHLIATAPAVDTGTTEASVTTDLDNVARPKGSAYDRGAYEYNGTEATPPPSTIQYDVSSAIGTDSDSTIPVTVTIGNHPNRAAILTVAWYKGATQEVNSVSDSTSDDWGGSPICTTTAGGASGTDQRIVQYLLLAPTVGAHTITITFSSSPGAGNVGAWVDSFYAVDQSVGYRSPATGSSGNSSIISTTVASVAGDMVVDGFYQYDSSTHTPGASQTQNVLDNSVGKGGSRKLAVGTSTTLSWTSVGSAYWSTCATDLIPTPTIQPNFKNIFLSPIISTGR